jgi:hypothetical protein
MRLVWRVFFSFRGGLLPAFCFGDEELMRSVPGADRGPRAGNPRGVVDATGS